MIIARDLSVRAGRIPLLSGIQFEARPGQLTAIAGPSGSGKTTLLKTLTGEMPHEGQIQLNGMPLRALDARRLAALRGVLPQSTSLAFPFSVGEVVALGLTASGTASRRQDGRDGPARRMAEALEKVGLGEFADRSYLDLSGGEQQRVQLARVLCQIPDPVFDGAPRWLFLDEPVSSLDIHHQLTIMQLARDFADAGGGVIAVMHDLNLTALFADQLLFLKAGRLVAAGALSALMTDEILADVFSCGLRVNRVPSDATPFVIPHSARA